MELSSSEIKKHFKKWNFLALILRNVLYFLKRKLFYISGNGNPEIILYILGKELSYISGNGNPKKHYYY